MKSYIVDASVGAKWCIPAVHEPLAAEAESLLEAFKLKEIGLVVPDLFWIEVANALWKSVGRAKLPLHEALTAFSLVQDCGIPTMPSATLLSAAINIATTYNRTVYDSVYVAMAVESSIELVTADEKLANALAAYLPVRWLGVI